MSFASASVTRDTIQFAPPPLILSTRAHQTSLRQPQRRRRRPEPLSCLYHRSRVPEPSLKVTNLLRPLIPPSLLSIVRDCSLE
jgi:hypothetical protein